MIEQYGIFENLQKAKKYLKDHKIPETDEKFIKLRELLKNNLGYMGAFTEWMYKDREPFDKIEDTFRKLKSTPNLDKQVDEFKKLEDLYDYLQEFQLDRKTQQIINTIPSKSRQNVTPKLKELIKSNMELSDLLIGFFRDQGGRYNPDHTREHHLVKPTQFASYGDWLYNDTAIFIKNVQGDFNNEAIKKKAEGYNADIVVDTPQLLMIRVLDFKASQQLGSGRWCIVTSESMWNSYVNDFTNQYFIYDFTKEKSDVKHLIGATISPGGKITSAHWADDTSVRDLTYFDTI